MAKIWIAIHIGFLAKSTLALFRQPAQLAPYDHERARHGFDLFRHLALALPAVGLGTFIGMSMFSKVNDRVFRCSALVIILASGCLMVFA
jgi:uncharacterized membrane protein YfcA